MDNSLIELAPAVVSYYCFMLILISDLVQSGNWWLVFRVDNHTFFGGLKFCKQLCRSQQCLQSSREWVYHSLPATLSGAVRRCFGGVSPACVCWPPALTVVEPGQRAWHDIRRVFGPSVFLESGEIDRVALGRLIFSDEDKRRQLNRITHNRIQRLMIWETLKLLCQGRCSQPSQTPRVLWLKSSSSSPIENGRPSFYSSYLTGLNLPAVFLR